jgi:hypothetical protein
LNEKKESRAHRIMKLPRPAAHVFFGYERAKAMAILVRDREYTISEVAVHGSSWNCALTKLNSWKISFSRTACAPAC